MMKKKFKFQINFLFALVAVLWIFTGCASLESQEAGHDDHEAHTDHDEHAGHDEHTDHDEDAGHNEHADYYEDAYQDEHADHDDEEGVIHLSADAIREAGIHVEKLRMRALGSTMEFTGTVQPHPQHEGFVGSLIEGRIREVFVDIGDRVVKGQALCIIESPAVGEAEAIYINTLADFEFTNADLTRHSTLADEGIGSMHERLELQAKLTSTTANVSAAARALQAMGFSEEDIEKLQSVQHTGGEVILRSPVSGSVVNRNARVGMQVSIESDLFHVVNLNTLRIEIDIPEQNASDVTIGSKIIVHTANGHLRDLNGVIERTGSVINPESRTITAFAMIENEDNRLSPGSFVTVELDSPSGKKQVLAVPTEAVFIDKHGDKVLFVEIEPGEFMLREVDTGLSTGGWIQLTSGVTAAEHVVTRGAFAIRSEANKSELGDGHNH